MAEGFASGRITLSANMKDSVIERVRRYLATLPPAVAGQRGHDATFRAACALVHRFGLPEEIALGLLLSDYNPRCSPPWTLAELAHKVRDALAAPSDKSRGYLLQAGDPLPSPARAASPPSPKWPAPNPERIREAVNGGPGALELWKRSPVRLDVDDGSNAAPIISALFMDGGNADPLLCVGRSAPEFATRPLSQWLAGGRLAEHALIVPAPMTARTGRTKAGRDSEHTLANTGPRRFIVVEFDTGTADENAARLWHLSGFAPLALVVHSGGKSLHGWFPVGGGLPGDVGRFMRYAASIGADPTLFRNRSQFVRLPGGTRENGCRQSVFFWNPPALTPATATPVNGKGAA